MPPLVFGSFEYGPNQASLGLAAPYTARHARRDTPARDRRDRRCRRRVHRRDRSAGTGGRLVASDHASPTAGHRLDELQRHVRGTRAVDCIRLARRRAGRACAGQRWRGRVCHGDRDLARTPVPASGWQPGAIDGRAVHPRTYRDAALWANALVLSSVAVYALALCIQLSVAAVSFYSLVSAAES